MDRDIGRLRGRVPELHPHGSLSYLYGVFLPGSLWPIILICLVHSLHLVYLPSQSRLKAQEQGGSFPIPSLRLPCGSPWTLLQICSVVLWSWEYPVSGLTGRIFNQRPPSQKWSEVKWSESHSVVSDSLRPHGLYSLWNSLGQNTGMGSLSLLRGIFPTQGSNPGLPHCRRIL